MRLYSHSFFLATWHLPLLPFLASLAHPPSAPQNTHLPRWTPVSQLQTWQEHISLQAWQKNYLWCYNAVRTQRGRRNDPHNLSSAIFIWNIYPLEKVTGGKFALKLRSDERWARILSQLNSIVLIIAKSQYFQLILYEMLILLGNGIIQQPISYYHWIYALL